MRKRGRPPKQKKLTSNRHRCPVCGGTMKTYLTKNGYLTQCEHCGGYRVFHQKANVITCDHICRYEKYSRRKKPGLAFIYNRCNMCKYTGFTYVVSGPTKTLTRGTSPTRIPTRGTKTYQPGQHLAT